MKPKVLITGGPVHSYIDPLTIITQRFSGIEMINIAVGLSRFCDVTFMGSTETVDHLKSMTQRKIKYVIHDGFEDYSRKALEMAPKNDGVILGAIINDLLPVKPYKEAFPSYKYKKGMVIPLDFYIAPRVIDQVRAVAPKTFIIGYHLSVNLLLTEQFAKAAEIIAASDADAVIINNPSNLAETWIMSKDKTSSLIAPLVLYRMIKKGRQDTQ